MEQLRDVLEREIPKIQVPCLHTIFQLRIYYACNLMVMYTSESISVAFVALSDRGRQYWERKDRVTLEDRTDHEGSSRSAGPCATIGKGARLGRSGRPRNS